MKKNILILLGSCILAACSSETKNSEEVVPNSNNGNVVELTESQIKNSQIEVGILEKKSVSNILRLNGKIDVPPQNMVSVSNPLGGYLKSTQLLPGMHIRKGEVIATMEDQQYIQLQQDYLTSMIKLEYAEAELTRQRELNKSKAGSDKVLQEAEMEFKSLKVALSAYSEKLKLININPKNLSDKNLSKSVSIYSPIDGFVSKVNVNIGKYVNPADILFELVNPTDIHLNLLVFEKDIDKLSIGQKLKAYTNTEPDKKHLCEIILISKDLSSDGVAEVHCHFKDYDKMLLPGMYMNAEVEVSSKNAFVISNSGLVDFEGKKYVFEEIKPGKYRMILVETLSTVDNITQIIFLKEIDSNSAKFVTKGAYTLLMKMKNTEEE